MKRNEIKELCAELAKATEAELQAKRLAFKQEMVNLGLQAATSQLQSPSRITAVRKAIARVETALTARRLAADAAN